MEIINKPYELIGIGFGPSNLALAVAIKEFKLLKRCLFLELQAKFSWHTGMLLEGSMMQTPFLKDLVSLYNPCSQFSFLSFLKEKGKLLDFISFKNFFPTRIEFNQYFKWAANKVSDLVFYGEKVAKISPYSSKKDKIFDLIKVETINSQQKIQHYLTKNIIIGIGGEPHIPDDCDIQHPNVIHSEYFLDSIHKICPIKNANYSFAIVGAGQSAAEICLYLLNEFKNSQVTILSRGFVFHSLDENPFINNLYSYAASKKFHHLPHLAKILFNKNLYRSNFSAVDSALIYEIYKKNYERNVLKNTTLKLLSFCKVSGCRIDGNKPTLFFFSQLENKERNAKFDAICYATGYKNCHHLLLNELKQFLNRDCSGNYEMNQHYRIYSQRNFKAGIYLQGYSQETHGFIEGTIADLAGRSQAILKNIYKNRKRFF